MLTYLTQFCKSIPTSSVPIRQTTHAAWTACSPASLAHTPRARRVRRCTFRCLPALAAPPVTLITLLPHLNTHAWGTPQTVNMLHNRARTQSHALALVSKLKVRPAVMWCVPTGNHPRTYRREALIGTRDAPSYLQERTPRTYGREPSYLQERSSYRYARCPLVPTGESPRTYGREPSYLRERKIYLINCFLNVYLPWTLKKTLHKTTHTRCVCKMHFP